MADFDPGSTPKGKLPPWEVCKAMAFDSVIQAMEKHTGKSCWELLGEGKAEITAKHLTTIGGGHPKKRAVQKHWTKKKVKDNWFPGKKPDNPGGRPPRITMAQKKAIADKAMELKQDLVAPTPEKVRICLPKRTINKSIQEPISDEQIRRIFKTMCYDEEEDDPWQFLPSVQQHLSNTASTNQNQKKQKRVRTLHSVRHCVKSVLPTLAATGG